MPGFVVTPDDQQLLARGTIPAWWEIVDAAVARIEAFHDAVSQRSAALDYSAAHGTCVRKATVSADFGEFPVFATKKNPQAVQAPGVREKLLPQLRLLCWAAGVSGDGDAAQPA